MIIRATRTSSSSTSSPFSSSAAGTGEELQLRHQDREQLKASHETKSAQKVHYDSGPNMTPLVDIVMVILIFLMLTGSFAVAEHWLQSNMPLVKKGPDNAEVPKDYVPDTPIRSTWTAPARPGRPRSRAARTITARGGAEEVPSGEACQPAGGQPGAGQDPGLDSPAADHQVQAPDRGVRSRRSMRSLRRWRS